MKGTEKINEICHLVKDLKESDFQDIEKLSKQQSNYTNPLKMDRQLELNEIGNHNMKIIDALKNLQKVIKQWN